MPFILSLLLFAAPFALIGAIIGYLIRHGQTPPVAFLGSGIPLIALGIAGLASVGIIILSDRRDPVLGRHWKECAVGPGEPG